MSKQAQAFRVLIDCTVDMQVVEGTRSSTHMSSRIVGLSGLTLGGTLSSDITQRNLRADVSDAKKVDSGTGG